jgi:prolyl oligopeptidase
MLLALALTLAAHSQDEDPYLSLEDVTADASLSWVKERNAKSTGELTALPGFEETQKRLLSIYDSDDKIPHVTKRGDWLYNLLKDGEHAKGLWRRTTMEEFRKDEPTWETVLDLDALAEEEGESWVWKGTSCLAPAYERCLLNLSRGGADAVVTREFDMTKKAFVDDGFVMPEAKSEVGWIDENSLFVSTDWGDGTMTESGYPAQVRIWKRGKPLEKAKLVYATELSDLGGGAYQDHSPGYEQQFVYRIITFFSNELFWRNGNKLIKVEKPDSAQANYHRGWLYIELREDWEYKGKTYAQGALVAADFKRFMAGEGELDVLFEPTERTSLSRHTFSRDHVVLNVLDNVKNKLVVMSHGPDGWTSAPLKGAPENVTLGAQAVDADESNDLWITASGYTTPSTLLHGTIGDAPEVIKSLPAMYDAEGLVVTQHEATSKDGTKIPYFQVAPEDLTMDGSTPTILYGYGGFEVSLLPGYSADVGSAWLEQGGVYVVANIRGGGEFGPRWHQAALKENRHRAYEDFIAVGEDLIARKVTTPPHLGIWGGSNGGLLMGNMLTMRPDLWGGILCQVPLLDMKRYHTLLAGASWMGEYGDPDDPEQWKFIQTFSPYHNLDKGTDYPPILITTSTRDDRVHPAHARKMTARMEEFGKDVLYYENIEGGHGGAANNAQRAHMRALGYAFLWDRLNPTLKDEPAPPTDASAQ